MDLSGIPYLIVSREVDFDVLSERVYVCLCLVDHLAIGIGATRDESLRAMLDEFDRRHAIDDPFAPDRHEFDGDDFELETFDLN